MEGSKECMDAWAALDEVQGRLEMEQAFEVQLESLEAAELEQLMKGLAGLRLGRPVQSWVE